MDNPPDDRPCEVTITAPDQGWLQEFVRSLVEDGLAAAGHVDIMHTTYSWRGVVEESQEARVRLHTVNGNVAEISARVDLEHSFEVPCVVAVPITGGNPKYLHWLRAAAANRRGTDEMAQ